jgi:hypothetical protein
VNIAHHQSHQFLDLAIARARLVAGARRGKPAFKAKDAEVSPAGGEIRFGNLLHAFKSHASILLGEA